MTRMCLWNLWQFDAMNGAWQTRPFLSSLFQTRHWFLEWVQWLDGKVDDVLAISACIAATEKPSHIIHDSRHYKCLSVSFKNKVFISLLQKLILNILKNIPYTQLRSILCLQHTVHSISNPFFPNRILSDSRCIHTKTWEHFSTGNLPRVGCCCS